MVNFYCIQMTWYIMAFTLHYFMIIGTGTYVPITSKLAAGDPVKETQPWWRRWQWRQITFTCYITSLNHCLFHWFAFNSYSASRDNWCTATLWNRIMTAQCEGMGEVGSARYEPALLPPCPSIRVLSYSNCQRSTHSSSRAWQRKC